MVLNYWNSSIPATRELVELHMFAADVYTISGSWTNHCFSEKEKKAMKENPNARIEPSSFGRRAWDLCFFKLYLSRLLINVDVVCSKSQYNSLDNVTLLIGTNFPDVVVEGVHKYDERVASKHFAFNMEKCIFKARSRLYSRGQGKRIKRFGLMRLKRTSKQIESLFEFWTVPSGHWAIEVTFNTLESFGH